MSLLSFAQQIHRDIHDHDSRDTRDILACGATTLDLLCSASGALLKSIETRSHSTSTTADTHLINVLDTLLAYANDHINAVNFQEVSRQWLRLYTDASLLRSAVDLLSPGPDAWREAVRRLDLTTIVAGSVGEGRSHWVQDLIREAQKNNARPATPLRPQKRVRHAHTQPEVHLSSWAAASIREMDAAPSFDRYVSQEYNRPFIVRGYASSWPALTRWKSAEYLLDTVGEGRVVPVETGLAYVDEDWGQTIMSFRTFLSRCGFDVEPEGRENRVLYLAQHTLFKQFPQLERDFVVPDYVWADLKSEEPNYEPVDADLVPLINVWIGHSDGHAISPAHTDPHYNCYVQVLGKKRVWLAPPYVTPHMKTYGAEDTGLNSCMTNTSRIPILREGQEKQAPPDFIANVVPVAQEAVLFPGDLLVMPSGWWHSMRGEGTGPGWSVSMWY